jgi:hypothetical protein
MAETILATFVDDRTRRSVLTVLDRAIDRQAEEMAHELLRDPEFKAEMQALMREAFARALKSLTEAQP